eukprot:365854-Chlamydomonas_euryale.AAC.3
MPCVRGRAVPLRECGVLPSEGGFCRTCRRRAGGEGGVRWVEELADGRERDKGRGSDGAMSRGTYAALNVHRASPTVDVMWR